jgi:hypothetical protein
MENLNSAKSNSAPITVASSQSSTSSAVRECLIVISMPDPEGPIWAGSMYDSSTLEARGYDPQSEHIYMKDDSTRSRGCVVRDLQEVAHTRGFTHCEVRDYTFGSPGSGFYISLYQGRVPEPGTSLYKGPA